MFPIQRDIIDNYFTYKIIHCGLILLSIQLNPKDFPNCEHIPILFLLVPRITYLACIINKILDYYRIWNVINISSDYKYWFESYGIILKSQYPIGVLFDICCKNRDSIHFHISMNIGNSKVISLNNQYDELIDNYINWPSFLKNFFNIIKLSQIITDNNCRQFQSITKKKYEELIDWIQMTCSSTNQYDDIIQSFFGNIDKRFNVKSLPIRIHIIDSINLTSVSLLRYYPIKSGENLLTFEDIFIDIVPIGYIDKVELIIHGIRPPLNTPLLFIAINCIYIDGFIHIVLNNKY